MGLEELQTMGEQAGGAIRILPVLSYSPARRELPAGVRGID